MKSLKFILFPLLIAGFLWACETTDPFVTEVESNLVLGNIDEALEVANNAIATDSSNGLAHFYRGVALGAKAESFEDPAERKPYYQQTRNSLLEGKEWMRQRESLPSEYEEVDEIITGYWAFEHNEGVEIVTVDSVRNLHNNPNERAIAHLENAITLQPDSALSYIVIASTYFNMGETGQAISRYEQAMERMDQPELDDYDFLTSMYLVEGRTEQAIALAEEAREVFPNEIVFVQYLADAYLEVGETDRAISLIRGLIADEPENPLYYRVLGTQLYQLVGPLENELTELYETSYNLERELRSLQGNEKEAAENRLRQKENDIEQLESEIDELIEQSVQEIKQVIELVPDDHEAYNILGIIYQNNAAIQFEKRNYTVDNQEASQIDQNARETLNLARENYERAAEINPDEQSYWQALFQVYTTLGMEEEARDAMEKSGM